MPLIKYSRNSDGTYGPTAVRKDFYVSKADHRKTARRKKDKTRWCINEGEEYSVFQPASDRYDLWFCKVNNCIFGLVDGGSVVLGENGERLAKFPNDRVKNEPWHGYPVFSEASQNRPSSELLDLVKDLIPLHVRIKLEKGLL